MKHSSTPALGHVSGDAEAVLADFAGYLGRERALASTTVQNYLNQVRPFVGWYATRRGAPLTAVQIQDVTEFLTWRARTCSPGSIMVAATGLRALLRWMFLTGLLGQQLAPAIGPVRYTTQTGASKFLPAEQVAALLAVEMSIRDRAVLLVLARLGLRAREAAELTVDDVNWRAGQVRIIGKGNDHQVMPLPQEVGRAVAAYLRDGRDPGSPHRQVFLSAGAPFQPLSRSGISCIVTRLAHRAGIADRVGAHRLRHSAATAVLAGGGTLAEAGQLLRHRSMATANIYAKTAPGTLTELARPWPAPSGPQPERGLR